MLVIADEVATGFGRTGTLFASRAVRHPARTCWSWARASPAATCPLSATVASRRVYEAFLGPDLSESTFYHGHSFSGNALACAVARRHLELVDEWDVLANVVARADQLGARLAEPTSRAAPGVGAVRRRGLMDGRASWPRRPRACAGVGGCAPGRGRGVLLRPLGDVVVLMPMLTSTDE